ncbi:MAG: cysteine--tRNA ligase, partial [Clostridia bacterium]|nr:cysteine--tRNA ligase [Clostridia bacterium]
RERFNEAMDDDLNTADALGVLFDFARWINIFATNAHTKAAIDAVKARYAELNGVLGLVVKERKEVFPDEALVLLDARTEAKKAKDWAKADAIRDQLKTMGFAVEDTREGAKLKKL